jgi:GNAT superfamily N-acetyltransferase
VASGSRVSPVRAPVSVDEVRRWIRGFIAVTGWLIRLQWFVKNMASVPAAGWEPSVPPGVSVRQASPDDAEALAPLIRGRESLPWRFARGDIALVAELDGHIVGCTWLTSRSFRPSYFPVRVQPAPGEWYNYGLALLRQHRGQGLGRMLSQMAMREVGRRGGSLVSGHASRFNRIAAASHLAAGFVTVEELIGLTLIRRFTIVLYRRRRALSGSDAAVPAALPQPRHPILSHRHGTEPPRG